MRVLIFLFAAAMTCVALMAHAGDIEDGKAGLMWNRSGLPAVFPLVVKSRSGEDYYLTLYDPVSDNTVLAAYITGGKFFKVLVPPGTFDVNFAAGKYWQDEDKLFGSETRSFSLAEPLTFAVSGSNIKSGHIIDLRTSNGLPILEAHLLCQRFAVSQFPRPLPPFDQDGFESRLTQPGELVRHPEAFFDPDRDGALQRPVIPTQYAPYFSDPVYALTERVCMDQ